MSLRSRVRVRAAAVVSTLATAGATLIGCGGAGGPDGELVVWSLENLTDRVRATEQAAARFTEDTGIPVRIVAIDENQFSQTIMSAAAAGRLPDVIGALPLTAVWQMAGNELLDTGAHQAVVDALGVGTFSPRALELTRDGDRQLAVPSDGWTQVLVYRADLFAAAGLAPPDTYDRILRAAETLHGPDLVGMSMATVAGDAATAQAFETLAVANGCQLVDGAGEVTVDAPACRETFELVRQLATRYSAPGAQDIESIRATYFAGRSAMVMWSSFLLDELGGLRDDVLPTCPECAETPEFLARNSGVVTAIQGPSGSAPVRYAEITSWTIPVNGDGAQAQRFVEYMMGERAYPAWFGMAPEGKVPVRTGTRDDPELFSRIWAESPAVVDTKRPLAEIYPPEVLAEMRAGVREFHRWGFDQGQGALVGATLGELPVPEAVNALLSGSTVAEVAEEAAGDVRSIKTSLE
ncbi:multiple sugar transport system substrate-binding protein [Amycolatopsis arida]|uniref:Multiple sugar transport system substrate-binding protein n=1 Tax=Amycolatopsis arida TaxID=587909 RepID=A0A1I5YXB6_9PSEU|nr:extracellular solute-binding protein [Amycolatopsis arida]TDX89933.1 multiple sugar transport system substrate-binding protein [Amycolatopsis arida]SFQ48467.1 multiple sugar transport system substrate-binding protein [Amycolatopsis arida]